GVASGGLFGAGGVGEQEGDENDEEDAHEEKQLPHDRRKLVPGREGGKVTALDDAADPRAYSPRRKCRSLDSLRSLGMTQRRIRRVPPSPVTTDDACGAGPKSSARSDAPPRCSSEPA